MQKEKKQAKELENWLEVTFRGVVRMENFDFGLFAEQRGITLEELISQIKNKEVSLKYDLLPDNALIDEVWEVEEAILTMQMNDEGKTATIDLAPDDSWGDC